jgi:hypothetical protein
MNFNDTDSIKENGFSGFISTSQLWIDRTHIPRVKGVYLVISPKFSQPEFLNPGVGGFFKGKNPNLPLEKLKENYVSSSRVVYIGKAGSPTGKATLYSRLGQYLRFGKGKNLGHYGGRLIWQLKNHSELLFCWKPTPNEDPREIEKHLLSAFIDQFGTLPFANLTR